MSFNHQNSTINKLFNQNCTKKTYRVLHCLLISFLKNHIFTFLIFEMKICIRMFPEKVILLSYSRNPRLEAYCYEMPSKWWMHQLHFIGFHSLVVIAFVVSNYKLLYVNIGAEDSGSDGVVFRDTSLFKASKYDRSWYEADTLPGGKQPIPFCHVTDDAIAIRKWLLNMTKPSPQEYDSQRDLDLAEWEE